MFIYFCLLLVKIPLRFRLTRPSAGGIPHERNFYKNGQYVEKNEPYQNMKTQFIPGYGFIEHTNGIFMFVNLKIVGLNLPSLVHPRLFLHNYKGHQRLTFTNWTSRVNNRANATELLPYAYIFPTCQFCCSNFLEREKLAFLYFDFNFVSLEFMCGNLVAFAVCHFSRKQYHGLLENNTITSSIF